MIVQDVSARLFVLEKINDIRPRASEWAMNATQALVKDLLHFGLWGSPLVQRALFIAFIVPAQLSRGGKGNAMKKGIRCNETRFTNGEDRDRIKFEFLSDDGVTPSSCTVRLGDIDPVSGQAVTNVTFFREYYRVVDHQVHKNLQAERPDYRPQHKAWRDRERLAFIEAFTKRWGYLHLQRGRRTFRFQCGG